MTGYHPEPFKDKTLKKGYLHINQNHSTQATISTILEHVESKLTKFREENDHIRDEVATATLRGKITFAKELIVSLQGNIIK